MALFRSLTKVVLWRKELFTQELNIQDGAAEACSSSQRGSKTKKVDEYYNTPSTGGTTYSAGLTEVGL